ncbi:hypothetical protein ACMHYB_41390 [Sorangium sp. So ce1128]
MATRRRGAAAAALWAALAAPSAGRAEDGVEPIRVRLEAHAGCPSEMSFVEQVRARTPKVRTAARGERARTFTIAVVRDGALSRGRLTIEERDGSSSSRAVSGRTCDEVVSAMALVTALAIDPEQAYRAPEPVAPTPIAELPGAPPTVIGARLTIAHDDPAGGALDPRRPAPYVAPASTWDMLPMPLPVLLPSPAGADSVATPAHAWRFTLGLHGSALGAASPELLPGISVFFDAWHPTGELFSPSLRLSLSWAEGGALETDAGIARFRLAEGNLDLCPLHLALQAGAGVTPCAALEAGALHAEGEGKISSEAHDRPWVALRLLGRAHLEVDGRFRVELQGGVTFPLVRDTFIFAPAIPVHDVPAVGGFFGAGAGVSFP